MISIIIPVKNRLEHLKQCLPTFVAQGDFEIIIVDYNCPQGSGQWVKGNFKDVRVISANVKAKEWNLCASRNIGIKVAKNPILGIFDADTIMEPGFIDDCLKRIKPGAFMCGYPIGKLHGCCVAFKSDMYAVGGYNEYLQGWGFDDQSLYNRFMNGKLHEKSDKLKYIDLEMLGFDENLVDLIRHEDALRVQYQNFKDIQATNHNNAHIDLHSGRFRGLESDNIKFHEI